MKIISNLTPFPFAAPAHLRSSARNAIPCDDGYLAQAQPQSAAQTLLPVQSLSERCLRKRAQIPLRDPDLASQLIELADLGCREQ